MDFEFNDKEKAFLHEVRRFFVEEKAEVEGVKEELGRGEGFGPHCWAMLAKIGEKGWLCPTWPREYGGLGLPFIYRYIIMEEMHHFLSIYATVGAGMAGPIIMQQGTEVQKAEYLPKIAAGKIEFALGYTEPNAGSDLARISLKAEDKGEYFLINGSKIFNTRVHYAQYHWLGARTAGVETSRHKGISLFIVDLKTKGISITPIWTVGGVRTNTVFYDNVKVPREALVGSLNKGFYYILEALDYERICTISGLIRDFDELLSALKNHGYRKDQAAGRKLAEIATEIEAARLLTLKVACMLDRKQVPTYEAAMLKMSVSETEQKFIDFAVNVLGLCGLLRESERGAPGGGKFEKQYRDSLENLITRGTSEIMRNVIATRGLGLPRSF